jgi:phosphate transport system substrate-binding protein
MKKLISMVAIGTLALSCLFAKGSGDTAGSGAQAAAPYTIEVGGSTSVTPLMELLVDAYIKAKPHIKVNINPTGSGDGIKNSGVLYQIGMTSRELTPAEQGQGLKEVTIAIDGIAAIVNASNPVSSLTIEQIRDIYTGAITDWSQVSGGAKRGRIAVISREEGSGTRGAFEELVGFQGKLLGGATESTSTGAIKAGIAQNQDAIGYISLGSLDSSVKPLSVNNVEATVANVVNGSYKIARPFIVLTGGNVHAESSAFVEWMLQTDAQAIVKTSWISVK